jgi:enoyl-CoA hydratase
MSVSISEANGLAVLTLDRPPANALDVGILRSLVDAVDELASAPPPALVITGRDPFFSGGVDLKAITGYEAEERREMVASVNAMALGVYGLPCPVVGAITGHAVAGGLVLAVCTDVRVASTAGRYGLTEIKVGVAYPQAAIGVIRAELPPHAVRVLVLGNQLVDAAECHRLGVFDEITEPENVLPRSLQIARDLSTYSPEMYARTKAGLRAETLTALRKAAADDPLADGAGWLEHPTYRERALLTQRFERNRDRTPSSE